jgi:predicted MFS family arabinose efflux permease
MVPAVNGLVSKLAAADEQGTMLGAVQAFAALGRFAGPEALGVLYDKAGAVTTFLAAAAIMVVGGLIALRIARPSAEPATLPAGAPGARDAGHVPRA